MLLRLENTAARLKRLLLFWLPGLTDLLLEQGVEEHLADAAVGPGAHHGEDPAPQAREHAARRRHQHQQDRAPLQSAYRDERGCGSARGLVHALMIMARESCERSTLITRESCERSGVDDGLHRAHSLVAPHHLELLWRLFVHDGVHDGPGEARDQGLQRRNPRGAQRAVRP